MENSNEKEINLLDLFFVIKSNIFRIIVCGIVMAILAFLYSKFFIQPIYKSSGKMVIKVVSAEQLTTYNDIQIAGGLVNDCIAVIQSRKIMQSVVDDLNLDCTADQLMGKIKVSSPVDSRVLQISTFDSDPERAQKIAKTLCDEIERQVGNLIGADSIKTFEEPIIPVSPSSPNIPKNTFFGGFAGATLMAAFVVLLSLLNNKIYNEEDVQNILGLAVLSAIPYSADNDDAKPIEDTSSKRKKKKGEKYNG